MGARAAHSYFLPGFRFPYFWRCFSPLRALASHGGGAENGWVGFQVILGYIHVLDTEAGTASQWVISEENAPAAPLLVLLLFLIEILNREQRFTQG